METESRDKVKFETLQTPHGEKTSVNVPDSDELTIEEFTQLLKDKKIKYKEGKPEEWFGILEEKGGTLTKEGIGKFTEEQWKEFTFSFGVTNLLKEWASPQARLPQNLAPSQEKLLDIVLSKLAPLKKPLTTTFAKSINDFLHTLNIEPSVQLVYKKPQDVLGIFASNSNDAIIPFVKTDQEETMDFRFLNGDCLTGKESTPLVVDLETVISSNQHSPLATAVGTSGPSGAGKTKANFDVARKQYSMYYECPSALTQSVSKDFEKLVRLLQYIPTPSLSSKEYFSYWELEDVLSTLFYCRVLYLNHLFEVGRLKSSEEWLLMQVCSVEHQENMVEIIQFLFHCQAHFPSWKAECDQIYGQLRQKHNITKLPIFIDEANRLEELMKDQFKSEKKAVGLSRPLLWTLLIRIQFTQLVLSGTQLRFHSIEEVLGSVIAKGPQQNPQKLQKLFTTQYLKEEKDVHTVLSKFILISPDFKYACQEMRGRFRFTIGFIDFIYRAIKLNKKKDIDELLDDWREEVVFARSTGSLFNFIHSLHTRGYHSVFLTETENIINIPSLLQDLVLYSLIADQFVFVTSNEAIDFVSLTVCWLEQDGQQVSIGEPWAILACLAFFDDIRKPILKEQIHRALEFLSNVIGKKESGKGKFLEWLTLLRLLELYGTKFEDFQLFKPIFAAPNCPQWFLDLRNTTFKWNTISADSKGDLLSKIIENKLTGTLVLGIPQARVDLFGLFPTGAYLSGGCKFYSKSNSDVLKDNLQTTDEETFFTKKDGSAYKPKRWKNFRKQFLAVHKASKLWKDKLGVLRLCVTLPTALSEEFSFVEKTRNGTKTLDVIVHVGAHNLQEFFSSDDVKLLQSFFLKE